MRRPIATTIPAVVAAVLWAAPAAAQDAPQVKYWPRHDISFPIDLAALDTLDPRPVSIRFYAARPDSQFKLIANKKPGELDKIVDTSDPAARPKRGFTYSVPGDRVEEFAVQYEFADGRVAPEKDRLVPQFRVVFDKTLPVVRAATASTGVVRWQATDDHLVESSVRVEGRYPGETPWQVLNTGDLKPDDSFKWNVPPGKTLEVRVFARDKAGNNGYSPVIRLGAKADRADGGEPKKPAAGSFGDPITRPDGARTGTGFGNPDDFAAGQVKMQYVSTRQLTVRSKVTHVTRSGVKAAQLFVQSDSADWRAEGRKDGLTIQADTPDDGRVVEIPFTAPKDGPYGFIIQPISGANTKAEDPRAGDLPQYRVEVDTVKPELTIKSVRVVGSGLTGPLVEVEWFADDKNLGAEPITLEYHDNEADMRAGKGWKPMHPGKPTLPNTGRYTWEITDKKLWKFWVRGQAADKATNLTLIVYSDDKGTPIPVLVDLDKPSGNVEKVDQNGVGVTPKQVNHTGEGGFPQPATLNVNAIAPAAPPSGGKAVPVGVGGRLPAPVAGEPKKEEPKPVPVPEPAKADPPLKVDPVPTGVVAPIPVPAPTGGGVTTPPPIPDLPPLTGEKK
jgi:hypothetical protein